MLVIYFNLLIFIIFKNGPNILITISNIPSVFRTIFLDIQIVILQQLFIRVLYYIQLKLSTKKFTGGEYVIRKIRVI